MVFGSNAMASAAPPEPLPLVWDSPSKDAKGSMPIGNGDIGLNVWVEPNGDLVFLIGKTDSFDDFNRLLKLGRIRVRTTPALVQPGQPFTQTLSVVDGQIFIKSGTVELRVWVDANHPVVQVDVKSVQPIAVQATLENWRQETRALTAKEKGSAYGNWPDKLRVNADLILPHQQDQIAWVHHNTESQWKRNLELTGLAAEAAKGSDPIFHRAFGAIVRGENLAATSDTEFQTAQPVSSCSLQVFPLTQIVETPQDWLKAAAALADGIQKESTQDRLTAHIAWWREFWTRSWISIASNNAVAPQSGKDARDEHTAQTVTQAYNLQRFVSACSGRGAMPIKFNGSIFTVAGPDPEFRNWGPAYWFQNTRQAYWAMLYAGDYDMMLPLFTMYRNALPLREAATRTYYHHDGAFFPETMYFWGNYTDHNYGTDRKGKPNGLTDNTYIRRYWQGGLELIVMMLDYYDGTQDAAFRDNTLLPLAKSILTFYDQHWPRGADGKILFDPAQSLETWHVAKNPLPEIAGLGYIIPRLMQLPVDAAVKTQWNKTLQDLPPVPTIQDKDGLRLLPAETYSHKSNIENPQLYGVFPYRTYTLQAGGENTRIGLATWNHRAQHEDYGWQQNCIQAALLGLANNAKAGVSSRAVHTAGYRFPGFFGPNYDWTPEQSHGTNMMTALQRMVLQCEGDQILLLPAWPKDWNASFKLHASQSTTVEGEVKDGQLLNLKVTPEARQKDVVVMKVQ